MTLYTHDYLEYYLTLVGWIINNGIWSMIEDSGLYALPFAVIVIREWLKVRGEGADEGNKGVLSLARIETNVYVGYVVVAFCALPVINVGFDTLEFDHSRASQCQYQLPTPTETGWNTSFSTLAGKSAQMPVWWAFMHALSKAVTSGAVASIPCGTDLRQMRMEVNNTRINNPLLVQEVADFTRDCYGRSRARLFMRNPEVIAEGPKSGAFADLSWVGSKYFLNTPGYYDTDYSRTPRTPWPYNSTRDVGLPQVSGGGGYPTCKQWWLDSTIGLKARLQEQIDPDLRSRFFGWARWLSQEQVGEALTRQLVSPSNQITAAVYTDYGGQVGGTIWNGLARAGGTFGVGLGSLAYFPAMDMVRQALPMVMAFLKMAMVISLPMVFVLGAYQLKTAMTTSIVFFSLIFIDFWFQLARWIDSTILDALYGSGSPHLSLDPVMGLNTATQDAILNFVMGSMFLILPVFWVTALTWAAINVGNLLGGLSNGTSAVGEAGKSAGGFAQQGVTTAGASFGSKKVKDDS